MPSLIQLEPLDVSNFEASVSVSLSVNATSKFSDSVK